MPPGRTLHAPHGLAALAVWSTCKESKTLVWCRAGAEAVAASASIAAAAPPQHALQSLLRAYLSDEHLEGIELGCPVVTLGSEMPRQAPEVRRAATRRIKEMIDVIARQSADWGQPGAHERALVTVATMVGAVLVARVVDDPRLSGALRKAALKHLVPSARVPFELTPQEIGPGTDRR